MENKKKLLMLTKRSESVRDSLVSLINSGRAYSAHPTSKAFEKPNASLFINALIILAKDLRNQQPVCT